MRTRTIGSLTVTEIGLGCNNFGNRVDWAGARAVVHAALDAGITFFDTADIYGAGASETFLGRALNGRRDEVVIATKYGLGTPPGASAAAIVQATEASLRRLETDRIDLLQQHAPDLNVPIDESLDALDRLVRDGKVREIGCSNFDGRLLDEAVATSSNRGTARFVSVQNELSLLRRRGEVDFLAACERHDIAFLPYFPLASGLLTGKYRRDAPPPVNSRLASLPDDRREDALRSDRFDRVEALSRFAQSRGHTLLELAISWLLSIPQLASVIAGATTPEQVRANVAAGRWELTGEDREQVDAISPPTVGAWGK